MASATEGSGSVTTRVAPGQACAYLADPRHAPEWFATVTVEDWPGGEPHRGLRWTFREGQRGTRRVVELVRLDCPRGFAWQTHLPRWRTNIRWDVEVTAVAGGGSTLRLTTRWQPGPLGWPSVLLLALFRRDALSRRSQRTIERAREALEAGFAHPGERPQRTTGGARRKARRGRLH